MSTRLYGYDRFKTPVPHEARVVTDAVQLVIDGETLASICRFLNDRGDRTSQGAEWRSTSLRRVLENPAIAGLTRGPDGTLLPASWEGIISPARRDELLAALGEPVAQQRGTYEYLLTGTMQAHCGVCGTPLRANESNNYRPGYRCGKTGCGKVRISANLLDVYIAEWVVAELFKPQTFQKLVAAQKEFASRASGLRAEIDEMKERQEDGGRGYAKGQLSHAAWLAADRMLKDRIRQARAELRRSEAIAAAPLEGLEHLVAWWNAAPIESKRAVTALVIRRIDVNPASTRGVHSVEPGRVQIEWRKRKTPRLTPKS